MEFISVVAILLLSLTGYSGGFVWKAGKTSEPRIRLLDIFLVLIIWAVVLTLRFTLDINRWYYLLIGTGIGILCGIISAWPRTFPYQDKHNGDSTETACSALPVGIWKNWLRFSKRFGHFQNRIFLSLFYFTLVAPVGILVRCFADPLSIKKDKSASNWTAGTDNLSEMEHFRRQF